MPRTKRQKSETGYYHVMCRGNNKQKIFINNQDNKIFLKLLKKNIFKYNIDIICYALMPNHFHLLLLDNQDLISEFMRSLNTAYAIYFNSKYKRIGKLYQDRFKSEVIENEKYLLTVFRYILRNPLKTGLPDCFSIERTSFVEIEGNRDITNPQTVINVLGGINNTISFLAQNKEEKIKMKDVEDEKYRLSTKNILKIFNKVYEQQQMIKQTNPDKQGLFNKYYLIKTLYKQGLNKNNIADLLGISKRTVYRTLKK